MKLIHKTRFALPVAAVLAMLSGSGAMTQEVRTADAEPSASATALLIHDDQGPRAQTGRRDRPNR